MGLQIKVEKQASATLLELTGRMTISDPLHDFESCVRDVLAEGCRHVVLDMANIAYIDSSGLGVLIGSMTQIARAGGDLKFINVPRRVQALLDISNLGRISEQLKAASPSGASGK